MQKPDVSEAVECRPDKMRAEQSVESILSAVETLMLLRDAARANEPGECMHRAIDLVARVIDENITVIDDFVFPGRRNIGSQS